MPIINTTTVPDEVAVSERIRGGSADASVLYGLRARGTRVRGGSVVGTIEGAIAVEVVRVRSGEVVGRVNGDANRFGEALGTRLRSGHVIPTIRHRGQAIGRRTRSGQVTGRVLQAQAYRLTVQLSILPTAAAEGVIRIWQPRLLVDGTEVPIITWSAPEGEGEVGERLSVVLQRWPDKDLFTDSSVINFGLGKKVAGVWDEASFITLIDEGSFQVSVHTISGEPANADDRVSITLSGHLRTRLDAYPETSMVLYDSGQIVQRPEFYQKQYDQFGFVYETACINRPGLSLGSLMFEILSLCGFEGVETNLPDYPIMQAFFPLGERWWDGLKKFLGIFSPIIYQAGGTIGIMDSTVLQPSGFPDPETIEVDNVTDLSMTDDRSNRTANTLRIRFIHSVEDYDIVNERIDDPVTEPDGDNAVNITRTWRTYAKSSQPFVVLREELVSETRETYDPLDNLISRSTETYTYTAANRQESRTQVIEASFPDLDQWRINLDAAETAYRLANPTATDEEVEEYLSHIAPPYIFDEIMRERETFEHAAFPIESLDGSQQKFFVHARGVRRTGLIITNPVERHLGEAFRQEFQPADRSGNITKDTVIEQGLIKSLTELGEPVKGGLVNYTTMVTDYLPPVVQVFTNYSQQRPGDIGTSPFTTSERTLLVRSSSEELIEGIQDLQFGELPLDTAIALGRRLIRRRALDTISAEYIGYAKELAPGAIRRLTLRDGTAVGTFMIIGRTPSGTPERTMTTLVCKGI
jgi:hypothetical protein